MPTLSKACSSFPNNNITLGAHTCSCIATASTQGWCEVHYKIYLPAWKLKTVYSAVILGQPIWERHPVLNPKTLHTWVAKKHDTKSFCRITITRETTLFFTNKLCISSQLKINHLVTTHWIIILLNIHSWSFFSRKALKEKCHSYKWKKKKSILFLRCRLL